jgi:hypothetical protein
VSDGGASTGPDPFPRGRPTGPVGCGVGCSYDARKTPHLYYDSERQPSGRGSIHGRYAGEYNG